MVGENTVFAALEFPREVVADIPKITAIGREMISVENYLSLLEYDKEIIRLKFATGVIEICGKAFEICAIGEGNISISGEIESIRYV